MGLDERIYGFQREPGSRTGWFLAVDAGGKKQISTAPEVALHVEKLIQEAYAQRDNMKLRESIRILTRIAANLVLQLMHIWMAQRVRSLQRRLVRALARGKA